MNKIILLLTLSAFLFSQQAEVTNIQAAQRTDGSQIVDITYEITPDAVFTYFNVSGEVSMDGGSSYEDMQFTTGDIGIGITAGTGRAITWGFGQQFNETYSNQVKIKINAISTAIIAGDSLEVPFEMITIPAGDYTYGENDEVQTIAYDYDIMKFDVTDYDYVVYLIDEWIGEETEICSDLTNLDGSPWHEFGGIDSTQNDFDCEWYVVVGCAEWDDDFMTDDWNNDAGYSAQDACCDCGGGSFFSSNINIQSNGIYGNYPGDAQYPAGEYLFLDFSQSKISHNGEIFEVEEGYVDHPVTGVTWFGAWHFAIHYGLQLPSQFEWEKAARGLTGYDYPWGDEIEPGNANYDLAIPDWIELDSYWWGGAVSFNLETILNNTSSVGFYNGVNEIQIPTYSAAIDYLIYFDNNGESPYTDPDNYEESGFNVPFTIENDCTDITFGLWDTYGIHNVYYEVTSLPESEIIFSGNVLHPGCPVQQEYIWGENSGYDFEAMNECQDWYIAETGDIWCPPGEYGEYCYTDCGSPSFPCNTWVVFEVECLSSGIYNFHFTSINQPPFLGELIGFINIDPGNINDISDNILTIDSPSPYGLYDMAGNVSQWLNKFPISSTSGIKGGNWVDTAENLVSWNIIQQDPITSSNQMGFRCIKPISVNLNRNPREMLEEHKRRHRHPPVHPSERKIDGN